MSISFDGFHGTSLKSAKEILKSNFELSIGDVEWLGNGVYFFISGISSKPDEQAEKWAIAQSWDKSIKENKYNNYCVIKSSIRTSEDYFLDLTKEEGLEVLEYLVHKFEDKIKTIGKKLDYLDGFLINLARGEGILEIDVVKGNFYIKFARERIKGIKLRTNNCTICTVYKPNENLEEITIIKTGIIKNETF
jgi:hypothetical protein